MVITFWIVTALFCLQISFTSYAQLRLPQVAEAFTRMGFPAYFRVELAWAKLLGVVLLLAPVPARLKEWAYAGFAITLVSAVIAHIAVGEGPEAWGFAVGTGVLWGISYVLWRCLPAQATPAIPIAVGDECKLDAALDVALTVRDGDEDIVRVVFPQTADRTAVHNLLLAGGVPIA
jgi:hypothetical protein